MLHSTAGFGSLDPGVREMKWRIYSRVLMSAVSGILFALVWIGWGPDAGLHPGRFSVAGGQPPPAVVLHREMEPGIPPAVRQTRRDPFAPASLESGRKRKKRRRRLLRGVLREGEHQFALIGNRLVTQGDWIFGMRVITIRENKVVLANNHKIRVLFLF
ncbi:MAG TPA: hypothetical protein ENJ23_02840 [Bacteroidetes bacterium]|nr:hypothetical protein [Bacteroidota bacterium]